MPKAPRLTATQAEAILVEAGFVLIRSRGSHRIYASKGQKVVIPFHAGKVLHPKIVKQLREAIAETGRES